MGQDALYLFRVNGVYPASVLLFKKALQSAMPKISYH